MKGNHSLNAGRRLAVACLLCAAVALLIQTNSHSQSNLAIRLTPTLSVTGAIGSWQQVQYSDDVSDPTNWTPLTNLLLTQSPVIFTDTTSGAPRRFYRSVTMAIAADTNLVWIPPGTFLMGSPSNEAGRAAEEGPQTLVTLTQGFFIGKFEVTEAEYVSVSGGFPATSCSTTKNPSFAVDCVVWDEATNYCGMLTARDLAAFRIPPGWAYRLPSEAEWEYACRAGTSTVFCYGNALYNTTNQTLANFHGANPYPPIPTNDPTGINLTGPVKVGSYGPNAFGIYDVHGNLGEWCQDANTTATPPPYPGGSVTNPVSSSGLFHVYRGGAYFTTGVGCRSAARSVSVTGQSGHGFRVVLAPAGP